MGGERGMSWFIGFHHPVRTTSCIDCLFEFNFQFSNSIGDLLSRFDEFFFSVRVDYAEALAPFARFDCLQEPAEVGVSDCQLRFEVINANLVIIDRHY